MRVLIVGASGQIGGHLLTRLRAEGHAVVGTYCTVARPGLVKLDLDDPTALVAAVRDSQPQVVILAAGWTWVDGNEDDPVASRRRNRDAPLELCRAVHQAGGLFVTYSTDYVFDGQGQRPYREDDPLNPLSVYGRAKLEMEEGLRELGPEHLILRTTTVYGPEQQGKNFVYQLVRRVRAGQPFRVPTDQVATPAYGPDVAAATLDLIDQGVRGTLHVAGPDALDRGAFARLVCAEWGLDAEAIAYLPTCELKQKARRPLHAPLDTTRLREAGIAVRGVRAGLQAMRAAVEAGGFAAL